MSRLLLTAALAAAIALVVGCGAPQTNNTGSVAPVAQAAPATPEPAVAPLPVVRIPAAAAKRVVLSMSGPKTVTEAKDWASFKEEWRATFADHAKAKGIAFSMQEGGTRPLGEPGTQLDVYVNDYRQVGIGARIFFGAMTGNAYIDAKVAFVDLNGGARFGEQAHNTSSSAWSGVFGKMTPQQVDMIATQVFGAFTSR